jgi:Tol biopolymer transport system component/serine/threonine protein kinase
MTPERWQRINEVFHTALVRPANERAAFLTEECAGDAELLAEVESLLAAHAQPGEFIDAPAYEAAAGLFVESPSRSLAGAKFGVYHILSQIGAGGMGEVYLAEDSRLGRQVALKLLPATFTSDPDRLRRFHREARATSALNHPNIVTIYDIGEQDGLHFIATEFIEGQTLRRQAAGNPMELRVAVELAIQVASALSAAHVAGVVHRDIKPENIMVRPDGLVKVLDFGLAKLTERQRDRGTERWRDGGMEGQRDGETLSLYPSVPQSLSPSVSTTPGVVMGTFNYMSPEQARGQVVDARTDLFSLGVVMHEMITGQRPFDGDTPSDVLAAILTYSPPPLQRCRAEVPAELQRIVTRTLQKDREERYQHSKELLEDLQDFKQEWEFRAKLADSASSVSGAASNGTKGVEARSPSTSGGEEEGALRSLPGRTPVPASFAARKWGLLLALVVLFAAGTAAALYSRGWLFGSTPAVAPPRVVPLTTFDGREELPAFSPDGNQIAFTWDGGSDRGKDIYVKLVGAGAPLRLTTDPADDTYPAWSPDGRHIAFIRRTESENEIFLVPALGGVERKIGKTVANTSRLAWSPDGKYLAVTDQTAEQARQGIFLLLLQTLEKRRITLPPPAFGDAQPAFSPDGKQVAFVRMGNLGKGGIFLQSMVGGEPRQVIGELRSVSGLAWTADGRSLVFSSNRTGSFNLWRGTIAGDAPELLAVAGKSVYDPAISRQGNRLAYNERFLDSNIWRLDASGAARSRRGSPAKLISSTRADHSPQFSPDGRRIVFVSDRSGNEEIWVCESDGTNPLQLTFFDGPPTGSPRWSPDGRQIVFDAQPFGNADIFVIAAEGGQPRALGAEKSYEMLPSWSQDGRWVYFCSNRGGSWQIWKMPATGGSPVQVTQRGGFESSESPDGLLLYYTKGRGPEGIWQAPVAGGEERAVPELSKAGYWRYWSVQREGICFLSQESPSAPVIKFFNFATRQVTPILTPEKAPLLDPSGLSLSPDRKWILYAQPDQSVNDLMLVENFR